jgi:CTP:molybdopterin cytidylyltransferase MocA
MTMALIPAGGLSSRMGRPKLALPVGDQTVLGRVIAGLRDAGIADILAVIGPHVPGLIPLAEKAGAQVLLLPAPTLHMRATIEAGLRWLEDRYHPAPDDFWLLVPGDSPTMDPVVVRELLKARAGHAASSIFVPTFLGKRGHPLLLAWRHVGGIRSWPADQGVNSYLRQQFEQTLEVPVTSREILRDLDTPADYEKLREDLRKRD